MEKVPQQSSKEELENKFGGNSQEYPKEITDLQKELSEQLVVHNKWCEENGLDPKDNEFFTDGYFYYAEPNYRAPRRTESNYISGKYKGKKIYINPGKDDLDANYAWAWKPEIPVIDIEGEERLSGKNRFHREAKKIFDKLSPYIAYDMQKIRFANEQIEQYDKREKTRPAREAYERARLEEIEKQKEGREAILNVLGVDIAKADEAIKEALQAVDEIEVPKEYRSWETSKEINEIEKTMAVIDTLNKRRDALLEALKLDPKKVALVVSGESFPSDYKERRVSLGYWVAGPSSWDEFDVTQKELEVSGEVNGIKLSLESTKCFTTGNREVARTTDKDIIYQFAEKVASNKQIESYRELFFIDGSSRNHIANEKMQVNIGPENSKEFIGKGADQFGNRLFKILFTLADYTDVLNKRIERIREERRKAEAEREANTKKKREEEVKNAEILKKSADFFEDKK